MKSGIGIKQPTIWIWVVAILLFLFHLLKIFAIIGPPILIALIGNVDGLVSLQEFKAAFIYYMAESASQLSIAQQSLKYQLLYSGITSVLFVSFSPFLGLRKNIARIAIMLLIGLEIIVLSGQCIARNIVPIWDTFSLYIIILIVLFLPAVSTKFQEGSV
ncbi:MAG: hypothetical protein ACYDBT_15850 [Desulfobulbaceae bacterium]